MVERARACDDGAMDRLALRRARALLVACVVVCAGLTTRHARAADLEDRLGRNETRVYSAPVPLLSGMEVSGAALDERLERLGYRRVHARPDAPGEYFHGREVYWFYRRACHEGGKDHPAERIGLELDPRSGRILGRRREGATRMSLAAEEEVWLEPELLSESLSANRADRIKVRLERLPERVWRPVLAAEDARFFEHAGVQHIRADVEQAVVEGHMPPTVAAQKLILKYEDAEGH